MKRVLLPVVTSLIALVSAPLLLAQAVDCRPALEALWAIASSACINGPEGTICNGGSAPQVQPDGPVRSALAPVGAMVEADAVTALRTYYLDPVSNVGGLAWIRLGPPVRASIFVVGDVLLRDVTPPDFPAWQAMVVETSTEPSVCEAAPDNAVVVQTMPGQGTRVVLNGASLILDGTVLARTRPGETILIGLSGQNSVMINGQTYPLLTGQQMHVPYAPGDFSRPVGPPAPTTPYDPDALRGVPVALFPRPIILPQPGYVRTDGRINLRSEPSTAAGIIQEVPSGQVLSVLGRDPTGLWFHVRLDTGVTGWMRADLLQQNVGPIEAVYIATPLPPQRYGELGNAGRVLAPAGANLRIGPDVSFPVVASVSDGTLVNLLARSPYNHWVKVEANGAVGWLALITLETHTFIDALPVDYDAPPLPTPTRQPGSFGNAFPDPNAD